MSTLLTTSISPVLKGTPKSQIFTVSTLRLGSSEGSLRWTGWWFEMSVVDDYRSDPKQTKLTQNRGKGFHSRDEMGGGWATGRGSSQDHLCLPRGVGSFQVNCPTCSFRSGDPSDSVLTMRVVPPTFAGTGRTVTSRGHSHLGWFRYKNLWVRQWWTIEGNLVNPPFPLPCTDVTLIVILLNKGGTS